jgi:hypothetical protein
MDCLKQKNRTPNINVYKADVYSLGMTLLYLTTFVNPINACYNFTRQDIDHDKVEDLLRVTLSRYSPQLTDLIRRMLLVEP